jgi:multidrug efflux pump subunit AcrA (membrane-fusion protein)
MVSATGQVTPNSRVDLKPKVNANVTGVYVKAGERVSSGQVLFKLDATDAYKQVRDAKTSLAAANLSLQKLLNPKTVDVLAVKDSIKQAQDAKDTQNRKVANAYSALLNSSIQPIPDISSTAEAAPTITGSYQKGVEGVIKISVYQGGTNGYSFNASGLVTASGNVSNTVAQPIGDSGLFIKWNSIIPQTNWIIDIPNKQSAGYLSAYTAWQNAITDRDVANAGSERGIESFTQKLADLTPGDDNLDVQSAKLTVQQRQNALDDAIQTLSNYTIVAPFDGVMEGVSVDIGSSAVMASANSSAALGTIVTDKKLAQISLNESDVVKVKIGQKANVSFDAIDGLAVEGTVVEINTLGTVTQGVVTYKVKVAFSANDSRILPNMTTSVDILTDSKEGVLYVPNQAVKHDANGYYVEEDPSLPAFSSSTRIFGNASSTSPDSFSSSTASSTRYAGGYGSSTRRRNATTTGAPTSSATVTLKRIPVTIGIQTDTQTEITSGLQEGDRIVLKKTTGTAKAATSAPSITSLLRPQGAGRATAGGTGNVRVGQ